MTDKPFDEGKLKWSDAIHKWVTDQKQPGFIVLEAYQGVLILN